MFGKAGLKLTKLYLFFEGGIQINRTGSGKGIGKLKLFYLSEKGPV
jgi:hypothetical protein